MFKKVTVACLISLFSLSAFSTSSFAENEPPVWGMPDDPPIWEFPTVTGDDPPVWDAPSFTEGNPLVWIHPTDDPPIWG